MSACSTICLLMVSMASGHRPSHDYSSMRPASNVQESILEADPEGTSKDDNQNLILTVVESWSPYDFSWFKAKEELLFGQDFAHPNTTKTEQMKQLLALRTEFLCKVILEVPQQQCLMDESVVTLTQEEKTSKTNELTASCPWLQPYGAISVADTVTTLTPKCVPVPQHVLNDVQFIAIRDSSSWCCAIPTGSVTMLSDLDFSVKCRNDTRGRLNVAPEDTAPDGTITTAAKKKFFRDASFEVALAKHLDAKVAKVLRAAASAAGKGDKLIRAAEIFDTNFYTNTFAYEEILLSSPCWSEPDLPLAMAVYAGARGSSKMWQFAHHFECTALHKLGAFQDVQAAFEGLVHQMTGSMNDIMEKRRLQTELEAVEQFLRRFADFTSRFAFAVDYGDRRNAEYYSRLNIGLSFVDPSKPETQPDMFCKQVPLALIMANEAYWVQGAIADVVEGMQELTDLQAFQSLYMNLGYALEHGAEAFDRPPVLEGNEDKCRIGDGLIKIGKYMKRVKTALSKGNVSLDKISEGFGAVVQEFSDFSDLKSCGSKAEVHGDPLGLPKAYLEASIRMLHRSGFKEDHHKGMCGVVRDLLMTARNVVGTVSTDWIPAIFSKTHT